MGFNVVLQNNKVTSEKLLAIYKFWQLGPFAPIQPVGPTESIPITTSATYLALTTPSGVTEMWSPVATHVFAKDLTLHLSGPAGNKVTLASSSPNDSVDFAKGTSFRASEKSQEAKSQAD